MARRSKGRGNRGRRRENNEQDRQQSRRERRENGTAAAVSDRKEKRKLDEEKGEETLGETAGPSERTNASLSQQSAHTTLSTEVKSEEVNAIPSPRSQDERPGPSELSRTPSTDPFVKPAGNTEKFEETRKSCAVSPTSEAGNTSPIRSCVNVPSDSRDGQEVTNLAARLGSNLSTQGTMETQMPSNPFNSIGRAFFPMDGQGRSIGEGCEVKFGFYQSARPSQWKVMLVNIDVSAKGFNKSQPVTEFVCETLGLRDLEDRRIKIDREKLKKAITGFRIETTHMGKMRRKFTVWGMSNQSAEKLHFEIKDEASKLTTKTTVAGYFFDTYGLELRYPHLPCLQVGRKRDCYLPMEVCTIIPCQKRHLSEQQTSNMIRSTARPAPERQRDIQLWVHDAQERITGCEAYLKDQFQTSIDPPPPLKLGPQDKALYPRDGSRDISNQALLKSAIVDMWALVCLAPCNEDPLRNFCHQMSSVSNRDGMKMTAKPACIKYGQRSEEVEQFFFDCLEQFPALQLIMVVLPGNDKKLYSEVKRVGDSVIGIPTQCVQVKFVQQAKPQVCANILLKINAKLGGTNHVIDDSFQPAISKDTIVFGADVTHPSPTENGIPSIAAVVASMDHHALKYHARARVQRHRNDGGAQEIIIDLAEIVKELLIEFIKTNGPLKPSKILFYRDGVSEGQFDQVLVHEVRAVQEACMKLEKSYRPSITFVVVQKGHQTRLFSGKGSNVPSGATVDSGIRHPYEFDFYLCSQHGIQGTSRPTHYHVLYDDNDFNVDSLKQVTYQLCHVSARCTRSVSMPAPAYYAHLAASRARVHVTNGNSGSVDLEKCARAIQVNDKMKSAMYFT